MSFRVRCQSFPCGHVLRALAANHRRQASAIALARRAWPGRQSSEVLSTHVCSRVTCQSFGALAFPNIRLLLSHKLAPLSAKFYVDVGYLLHSGIRAVGVFGAVAIIAVIIGVTLVIKVCGVGASRPASDSTCSVGSVMFRRVRCLACKAATPFSKVGQPAKGSLLPCKSPAFPTLSGSVHVARTG